MSAFPPTPFPPMVDETPSDQTIGQAACIAWILLILRDLFVLPFLAGDGGLIFERYLAPGTEWLIILPCISLLAAGLAATCAWNLIDYELGMVAGFVALATGAFPGLVGGFGPFAAALGVLGISLQIVGRDAFRPSHEDAPISV